MPELLCCSESLTAVIVTCKLSHKMYLMKNANIDICVYLLCVMMCHVPFICKRPK